METIHVLGDHLWQSTVVAAAVGLLTLAFRHNRAPVRYGLWMTASLKFLLPFTALTAFGRQLGWLHGSVARPAELVLLMQSIGQPFSRPTVTSTAIAPAVAGDEGTRLAVVVIASLWVLGCAAVFVRWAIRWHRVSVVARTASRITEGSAYESLRRLERLAGVVRPTPLLSSVDSLEPGVFGVWRPVLMWPRGIERHLDQRQIDAILSHEIAHIKRRDNLTAALHMLIEAAFWFHPLVWWLGARLVDERERACDEEVVRLGTEPHVYAESVLRTCQFSVESPLACVAGVTGSDLRKRIELIMKDHTSVDVTVSKRLLLAAAAVVTTVGPIALGVVSEPRLLAQVVAPGLDAPVFEAASIKPAADTGRRGGGGTPGRFVGTNLPARVLIRQAYDIHDSQIIGGPDWLNSQGFDINATMEEGERSPERRRLMMQTLLRDRFKLTFHPEKREMPIYALVVARSDGRLGSGLKKIPDGECPPPGARRGAPPAGGAPSAPSSPFDLNAQAPCGSIVFGPGRLLAHGVPIDMLARSIGGLPAITAFNRIVVNETKLEGQYDFDFKWTNEFTGRGGPPPVGPPPAPAAGDEPTLVTALQEQLGLKLDPRRATVDVLMIDSVEKPTEN